MTASLAHKLVTSLPGAAVDSSPPTTAVVLIVLGGILLTVTLITLLHRDRVHFGSEVRRVLAALGVTPSERRLLKSIARRSDIPPAGVVGIVISHGCFEHAREVAGLSLPDQERAERLRERLFSVRSPQSARASDFELLIPGQQKE